MTDDELIAELRYCADIYVIENRDYIAARFNAAANRLAALRGELDTVIDSSTEHEMQEAFLADRIAQLTSETGEISDDELIKLYTSPRGPNDYAPMGLPAWPDGLRAVWRAGRLSAPGQNETP